MNQTLNKKGGSNPTGSQSELQLNIASSNRKGLNAGDSKEQFVEQVNKSASNEKQEKELVDRSIKNEIWSVHNMIADFQKDLTKR